MRNLRQMAAVKATFVILSSQIRTTARYCAPVALGPLEPGCRVAVSRASRHSKAHGRMKSQQQSYRGSGVAENHNAISNAFEYAQFLKAIT